MYCIITVLLKLKITTMSVCTHPYVHDKKKKPGRIDIKNSLWLLVSSGNTGMFYFPTVLLCG